MLEAVCPNGHRLQVPLEHAGMKLRCPAPGCGVIFQLSATSPTGSTLAVNPSTSGPNLPSTAPAPAAAAAPAPAPAPAAAQQPQSSQTYGTTPLAPAPAGAANDGGRWAGTEAAPNVGPVQPGSASQSGPQATGPLINAPLRNAGPRSVDLSGGALLAGAQAVLMLGLVLVLTARGCDGLGARNVTRLKAKLAHEQQTFEGKYQETDKAFAAELDDEKLNEKAKTDLTKKRDEATKAHGKARIANASDWAQMQNAADDAATSHMMWGYWREMMFVVGTILLSLGLTAVAFVGQGIERYLCFGLLAIIVFSVYVGGAAWFSSIVGGLSGMVPGR